MSETQILAPVKGSQVCLLHTVLIPSFHNGPAYCFQMHHDIQLELIGVFSSVCVGLRLLLLAAATCTPEVHHLISHAVYQPPGSLALLLTLSVRCAVCCVGSL